ncbi:MAG: hypothetical protein HN400_02175, partial [Nitrospinaceae bacterium]|nr:hypothetical protein [Nitrospinaceae bacterium]
VGHIVEIDPNILREEGVPPHSLDTGKNYRVFGLPANLLKARRINFGEFLGVALPEFVRLEPALEIFHIKAGALFQGARITDHHRANRVVFAEILQGANLALALNNLCLGVNTNASGCGARNDILEFTG